MRHQGRQCELWLTGCRIGWLAESMQEWLCIFDSLVRSMHACLSASRAEGKVSIL